MALLTPPSSHAALLLDAGAVNRAIRRIAHEIIERNPLLDRLVIAGVPSRGVSVARRLIAHIEEVEKVRVPFGTVDISMHRDDLRLRKTIGRVEVSDLPLDLDDRTVILADDVIFTGRTCRAALDAITSFGRPARIQLAVLIDRGHREVPIRADYVGKNVPTAFGERVFVRLEDVDDVPDSVWLERA